MKNVRSVALTCLGLALLAFFWQPSRPALAMGVLGGGVLAGLSFWAIGGLVDRLTIGRETGEIWRVSAGFVLVKFFTRHVILAIAAYGMMVRLHLDPVGMIVGVASAVLAAAFEARRR